MAHLTVNLHVGSHRVSIRDAGGLAPLYVSRRLLNAADVVSWAKSVGLDQIETAADMHVTVVYSKTPVDWFKLPVVYDGDLRIDAGGPRRIEMFGGNGKPEVVVLRFASVALLRRWSSLCDAGCRCDWPDYAPHVTVARSPGRATIAKLIAYPGVLVFGPEIFAPIRD